MQSRAAGDAPRAAIYCRLSEEDADKADPGQDSRSIQNWAISSVSFCIKNHLMQGDDKNAFNPTGNVNRAQVAKALSNIAAAAKK